MSFRITAWEAPLCSYKDFLPHLPHRCENLFTWKRTLNIYWHLPGICLKCRLFCCIMGWHRGTGRCSLIRTVICDSSVTAALVTDSLLGVYRMCSVGGLGKPTWDQILRIFFFLFKKIHKQQNKTRNNPQPQTSIEVVYFRQTLLSVSSRCNVLRQGKSLPPSI